MKRFRWSAALAVMLFCLHGTTVEATTRYVDAASPAPQAPYTNWASASTNIQVAIDISNLDDQILVAPGQYKLSGTPVIIPQYKRVYLMSTQSRGAVIDAQRLSRGVTIFGTNSILEGFTIRNGAVGGYGGGVELGRAAIVRDCLIESNRAYGAGGVMFDEGGLVENCTIRNNLATYFGGGVIFYNYSPGTVKNCEIYDNIASNTAGGVEFQGGGNVINCRIYGNRAVVAEGGGAYIEGLGTIMNSLVYGNIASNYGGGIYAAGSGGGRIIQSTVVSNTSGARGGGVYAGFQVSCWNSIVYYNTASTNPNLYLDDQATASNCCVIPSPSASNFTNDPWFVNAASKDFRLKAGSPCVDAGCTNYAPLYDFEGRPRPVDGNLSGTAQYDVGAYEYALHFKPGMAISNNTLTLTWDIINRGGYILEAATNADNPYWFRLTDTNYWMGQDPSVRTQSVILTNPQLIYRLRALHTLF
jgi:parallel beta-helix repeat protein